jgi:hypothetical protein
MPADIDIDLIQRRISLINDSCNKAITELTQRGALRVPVEHAFTSPDHLVRLITHICLLKQYATAAALNHGQHMGLAEWQGWFEQFSKDAHVLPSGKLS